MIEVRIHGRGGQGNVIAAYILATAAFAEGWYAQAFPAFGAERRGAPVAAFVRISNRPIRRRCQVVAPDALIIQDDALLHVAGITDGLRTDGCILLNGSESRHDDYAAIALQSLQQSLVTVPATALAQQHLGRPIPNTALLAAFLGLTQLLPVSALIKALAERFRGSVLEKNQALVEAAAAVVEAGQWQEAIHGD